RTINQLRSTKNGMPSKRNIFRRAVNMARLTKRAMNVIEQKSCPQRPPSGKGVPAIGQVIAPGQVATAWEREKANGYLFCTRLVGCQSSRVVGGPAMNTKSVNRLEAGWDAIDEASEKSFPASDPPSWTPLHLGSPTAPVQQEVAPFTDAEWQAIPHR